MRRSVAQLKTGVDGLEAHDHETNLIHETSVWGASWIWFTSIAILLLYPFKSGEYVGQSLEMVKQGPTTYRLPQTRRKCISRSGSDSMEARLFSQYPQIFAELCLNTVVDRWNEGVVSVEVILTQLIIEAGSSSDFGLLAYHRICEDAVLFGFKSKMFPSGTLL